MADINTTMHPSSDVGVSMNESSDIAIGVNPSGLLDVNVPHGNTNVVVNGTFDTDTVWSKGAGWTITGGKAVGTAVTSNLRQSGILEIGETYKVSFDVSDYASGSFLAMCGASAGALISADGRYTELIVCTGNTDFLFNGVVAFNGKIDNVIAIKQ